MWLGRVSHDWDQTAFMLSAWTGESPAKYHPCPDGEPKANHKDVDPYDPRVLEAMQKGMIG